MAPNQPQYPKSRALLIGSAVAPLIGPARDLHVMEEALKLYGFSVTKCSKPSDGVYLANRAGIISAWKALINQTGPSDAVVIYYSGHGGLTEAEGSEAGRGERRMQYIVPLDFAETVDGDWRGISDAEMADLLYQTTQKTQNVTIILDCCHSAHMARGPTWAKAINPDDYRQVMSHIRRMLEGMASKHAFHYERNPHVLSIVAAGTSEPAYERRFLDGERMGVLTEALTQTLRSAVGAELSWRDIMRRVRDRMCRTCPEQYPDIEGPQARLPFRLETAKGGGDMAFSVTETAPGEFALKGGVLHGLSPGDVLAVMPFEEGYLVQDKMIAEAEVTGVGPIASRVRMKWRHGRSGGLTPGAKAFMWKSSVLLPVNSFGPEDWTRELREELRSSAFIRLADTGEESESIGAVELIDSHLVIRHHQHYLVREWDMCGNENRHCVLAKCVRVLESLARAQRFLDMRNDASSELLELALSHEIGYVKDGLPVSYPGQGVTLVEDTRIYISVTNTGTCTLYVSMFDICADSVTLLSNGSPSGIELLPGKMYRFGEVDITRELRGSVVGWPADVPKAESIPETIALVVTYDKIDLRNLETGPESAGRERSRASGLGTWLTHLVDSIAFGDLRNVQAERQVYQHMPYRVVNIPCQLTPRFPSKGC
ncbi:hypothetical protein NW760_012719 [Fusarium oxysporum]|nr:hypothetical protein NW769_012117 [Fusarium oxysporum]KAJ4218670.1 hypothetical protein NW760_012719 [Fusarium oxysporum]